MYYPTNLPILSNTYQLLCLTIGDFMLYVLPYYGFPDCQAQEAQTLLLRRRQRPRPGPSSHRPPNLSGQRRKGRRPAQGAHRSPPPLGHPPRVGSARSPLVSRSAIRRLRLAAVPLGTAPLRSLPGSLPVAGSDAPHLLAWSQDHGGRLVSADHPLPPLGLRAGALLPPSLLGRLRATPAGERSFGAKRRTLPAGGSASPPARPVEGEAAAQSPFAGL